MRLKKARGGAKAGLKRRAMQVLKRKKMYEKQRDQLAAQSFNLEQVNFTMDTLKDTATTVEAMKEGAKTLKQQYKEINIDEIEDVQDDLADLMADAEEVQDVLGRSYDIGEDVDEDELDAELAGLDDELEALEMGEDETPAYLADTGDLPSAPTTAPAAAEGVDEFGLPAAAVQTS